MIRHIKRLLETDWYYVRCVNAVVEDTDILDLTWKVDVGQHAWRTLKDTFYLDEGGMISFYDMCEGIKYVPFEDTTDEMFPLQFLYKRAKVYVDRKIEGEFKINRIIEYSLADVPPEFEVHLPKDDSHFHHTKNNRKLPIQ